MCHGNAQCGLTAADIASNVERSLIWPEIALTRFRAQSAKRETIDRIILLVAPHACLFPRSEDAIQT